MYDPEEQDRPQPPAQEETWDQWFDRTHGRRTPRGWRLALLVASVAIASLYWISVARGG